MVDKGVRGVLDVARSVLSELDLEVVLDRVLHAARGSDRRAVRGARRAQRVADRARALPHGRDGRGGAPGDRRPAARSRRSRRADQRSRRAPSCAGGPARALLGLPGRASADGHVPRRPDPRPRRAVREPLPHREGRRRRVHQRRRGGRRPARRVRRRRDRPRGALHGRPRAPGRSRAHRRRPRGDHADHGRGRRADRSRRHPRARRQARARARLRPHAADRARARRRADRRHRRGGGPRGARRRPGPARRDGRERGAANPSHAALWRRSSTGRASSSTVSAGSGSRRESGLVVPLVFRNRTYGVLLALDRLGGGDSVHERGPAAPGGIRGERRDGRGDRDLGRGGTAPAAAHGRGGRAPPLGARAPRRDAPEHGRAPAGALRPPGARGNRKRSRRPSATRSAGWSRRSAISAR